jgi:hypothetical protein
MFDTITANPEAIGEIVGAIIGVTGLVVGTFITILTSLIIRHMDIRREERREEAQLARAKKEKEFGLKQEVYSAFVSELAALENFISKKSSDLELKDLETFDSEWMRIEIRVDLVANAKVKELKDRLETELLSLAKQKFSQKDQSREISLGETYMGNRSALLEAIREDMEITTNRI